MYFVVKYSRFNDNREVLVQTENAIDAFYQANIFDAQCKVGVEENDTGQIGVFIQIEDENGNDCWQKCATIACPPVGIFN